LIGNFFFYSFSFFVFECQDVDTMNRVNNIPNEGVIRFLGMLNTEHLLIVSAKALGEVLTTKSSDFIKPPHFAVGLGRVLGSGILLAEGDEHKTQRKNLLPAFAFRHIKDLYPVFWGKSTEVVTAITKHVKAEALQKAKSEGNLGPWIASFEVGDWASRVTLDIIGVAGMGRDFGTVHDPQAELSLVYKSVLNTKGLKQAYFLGMLSIFLPSWFVESLPVKRNSETKAAADIIRATCTSLIRAKKDKLEKRELLDVDIISVALESGGFTEETLIDQMMTFLIAGHETTSTSLIWAIYLLCVNPEVQTRLRAEIRENLPSPDAAATATVTSQQIDHMSYLNAVCSEVLRFYPPVPLIFRDAAQDTSIQGHFVPKGTRIMISPWATNKDVSLWGPDASKFNPDRWLVNDTQSANGGAASNYAFLTFLQGPRSCIGQTFARAEFACLLAAWVGRLEFTLKNELEFDEKNVLNKAGVTAKPQKGLFVKTRIVDGW
jgi:cytochrome P450